MSRGTPMRTVRMDDERWQQITAAAEQAGCTRSDVLRWAVDRALGATSSPAPTHEAGEEEAGEE